MSLNDSAAWLLAYDISSPRRLARIHRTVAALAIPVQYSLYFLLASQNQVNALVAKLQSIMDPTHDDIRIYRVPNDPCLHTFGSQRCQIPLVLSASLPEGIRHFSRQLFSLHEHLEGLSEVNK